MFPEFTGTILIYSTQQKIYSCCMLETIVETLALHAIVGNSISPRLAAPTTLTTHETTFMSVVGAVHNTT